MAATDRASALPADDSYLSDLLSYGVERLNEEPDRLASERQRAERQRRGGEEAGSGEQLQHAVQRRGRAQAGVVGQAHLK